MKVRVNRFYTFTGPCLLDAISSHPADVKPGQVVKVVNKFGSPPANTMGQCYVEDQEGRFLGMVSTSCLEDCTQPKPDNAPATQPELRAFCSMCTSGRINGYNDDGEQKRRFAKLGQKVARLVAKKLGLKPGTFDVRFNPGGNAVSGDIRLHSDTFYLTLEPSCTGLGFMFRSCKGRQDYTGGPNQWMTYAELRTINKAVARFRDVAGL